MAHRTVKFVIFGTAGHDLHAFFADTFVRVGGSGVRRGRVDGRIRRGVGQRAGNTDSVFERVAVFHIQLGTRLRSFVALVKVFGGDFFLREIELQADLGRHVFRADDR